ncbi:MAG: DUF2752 domain-containing protein [Lachnospiraceae bacterium]|nr:DUF2752 domain-containing protein [Lachnospiraceae bacterium]
MCKKLYRNGEPSMKTQQTNRNSINQQSDPLTANKRKHIGIKKTVLQGITLLLPLAGIFIFTHRDWLLNLAYRLPPCPFYSIYHVYCPSCGNTRSVSALFQGKLLTSLRYNIIPILLLLFCLCGYLEAAAYSFGKPINILPRNYRFYLIGGLLIAAYLVFRNFIPYLTP